MTTNVRNTLERAEKAQDAPTPLPGVLYLGDTLSRTRDELTEAKNARNAAQAAFDRLVDEQRADEARYYQAKGEVTAAGDLPATTYEQRQVRAAAVEQARDRLDALRLKLRDYEERLAEARGAVNKAADAEYRARETLTRLEQAHNGDPRPASVEAAIRSAIKDPNARSTHVQIFRDRLRQVEQARGDALNEASRAAAARVQARSALEAAEQTEARATRELAATEAAYEELVSRPASDWVPQPTQPGPASATRTGLGEWQYADSRGRPVNHRGEPLA